MIICLSPIWSTIELGGKWKAPINLARYNKPPSALCSHCFPLHRHHPFTHTQERLCFLFFFTTEHYSYSMSLADKSKPAFGMFYKQGNESIASVFSNVPPTISGRLMYSTKDREWRMTMPLAVTQGTITSHDTKGNNQTSEATVDDCQLSFFPRLKDPGSLLSPANWMLSETGQKLHKMGGPVTFTPDIGWVEQVSSHFSQLQWENWVQPVEGTTDTYCR